MVEICPNCGNYDYDKTVEESAVTCPNYMEPGGEHPDAFEGLWHAVFQRYFCAGSDGGRAGAPAAHGGGPGNYGYRLDTELPGEHDNIEGVPYDTLEVSGLTVEEAAREVERWALSKLS